MHEEYLASIGWGPIRVGPLPMQINQSDVSSWRQARKPFDAAWQGVQAFQMERNINPLWNAGANGNPYYHRQREIAYGQKDSQHAQWTDAGSAVVQNAINNGELTPPATPSYAASALSVIRRKWSG
jgi:hypothetical protein